MELLFSQVIQLRRKYQLLSNHRDPLIAFSTVATTSFLFDELELLMKNDIPPVGCIIMSGDNISLYTVCGTEITLHITKDIDLRNKHNKGGQSSVRFERLADEDRHNYIMKSVEMILRVYKKIPVIIAGPAYMKDRLAEKLTTISHAPKILRIVDTQYDKKSGLNEVLSKCSDLIISLQISLERECIQMFLNLIATNPDIVVYGDKNVLYALENGLIEKLLLHDSLSDEIEHIEELCKKSSSQMIIISDFLPESNQILKGFGGKVGILRYPTIILTDRDENTGDNESFEW